MIGALIALRQAIAEQEVEQAFIRAVEQLPPEMREQMISKRNEHKRIAHEEATEERRHKELCSAIRSTSFWGF